MKRYYYYLHTNGDIIGKNPFVVESDPLYFNSPFVKRVWCIDTSKREDAWKIALEGLALGANENRIKELSIKWGLTFEDSTEMLKRNVLDNALRLKGFQLFIEKVLNMSYKDYQNKIEQIK